MVNPIDEPRAPSAIGYWLGALAMVAGIAAAIWWGASGFLDLDETIDDFERVPVDQLGRVELGEGEYVAYAEGGGEVLALAVGEIRMRPVGGDRDDEIEFQPYGSEVTYDFSGRSGRAQSTFRIEEGGDYRVRAQGVGSATSVAFGPSIAGDLVSAILGAFVLAGVGIVIGAVLLIVTGIRRRRHRQRNWLDGGNRPSAPPSGYPPPPAPPAAPPPPPPSPPVISPPV
jgi:hypothetical protein